MVNRTHHDPEKPATADEFRLADPTSIEDRDDITVTATTEKHETEDHCGVDSEGDVVVAVRNSDGELLLMRNDEFGIAVLPHGTVDPGQDWAAAAREDIEAVTGVSIALDSVDVIRHVDHIVEGDDEPHTSTYRVIFTGHPVGGAIQDCKQHADAGSDRWWTCWSDGLPADASVPPGGPGDDLRHVLD